MKKLLTELIKKYFAAITENWTVQLVKTGNKLTETQINTFVENSLNTILDVMETGDYSSADQYLIDIYTLFSNSNLNLLEVSQLFSGGRFAVLNSMENNKSINYFFHN